MSADDLVVMTFRKGTMRIYKIDIEHTSYGRNYNRTKVDARTFDEALRKAKKILNRGERIESITLLESTD